MPRSGQRKGCKRIPSFFKVLMGDFSTRLRIPPAFVKHIYETKAQTFKLRGPARICWHVDIEKVDDDLFFKTGWRGFVVGNSLEFGDFLVFAYLGDEIFRVKIYGRDCCLKEPTPFTRQLQAMSKNLKDVKGGIEKQNQDRKKRKRESLRAQESESSPSRFDRWTRSKSKRLKGIGSIEDGQGLGAKQAIEARVGEPVIMYLDGSDKDSESKCLKGIGSEEGGDVLGNKQAIEARVGEPVGINLDSSTFTKDSKLKHLRGIDSTEGGHALGDKQAIEESFGEPFSINLDSSTKNSKLKLLKSIGLSKGGDALGDKQAIEERVGEPVSINLDSPTKNSKLKRLKSIGSSEGGEALGEKQAIEERVGEPVSVNLDSSTKDSKLKHCRVLGSAEGRHALGFKQAIEKSVGEPVIINSDDSTQDESRKLSCNFSSFKVSAIVGKRNALYMKLPEGFKEYKGKTRMDVTLRTSNKSWPALISQHYNNKFRVGEGWTAFVNDNSLRKGNHCELEFIDGDQLVINVSFPKRKSSATELNHGHCQEYSSS